MANKQQITAAVKRIIRSAPGTLKGLYELNKRYVVCDGARAIRFYDDIPELTRAESGPNVDNIIDGDRYTSGVAKSEPLMLPTVKDLKEHIAKSKAKKRFTVNIPYELDGGEICVNAQYLSDMLQALPKCKAYKPMTRYSPIYFKAENGDGILMPMKVCNK